MSVEGDNNGGGLRMTRRRALGLGLGVFGAGAAALASGGHTLMGWTSQGRGGQEASDGRLNARPRKVSEAAPAGLHPLKLEGGRDGLVYVPAAYKPERPWPLVLMLHGAGGDAGRSVGLLRGLADESGMLLVVPDSRGMTWDVIRGRYGPDVAFIDRALAQTFGRYAADPARVAAAGFSDGASYALSLGITNGDLFTHVLAFSPGFMVPAAQRGAPALYISHGTRDRVLPIENCSRRIVPQVKKAGYSVLYKEFDGPHTVPPEIAREAVGWFLKGGA
jgi:phospholipase/carboxylesterase